jgi:hypothetical protein
MIISVSNHADRIRLIAIEIMEGAFGNEGALLPFAIKTAASEQTALPTLKKVRFHVPVFPTRLLFALVRRAGGEQIKGN